MLQHVQLTKVHRVSEVHIPPFGSAVYLISAVFDPKFRLKWIDKELDLDDESKEDLHKEVTGCLAVNWSFGLIGCIYCQCHMANLFVILILCVTFEKVITRSPAKARGGRPYETGSRNMAATQKINFLTPVSYSLFQTLFR